MAENLDVSAIVSIIGAIVTVVGASMTIYANVRKLPSEINKTNSDSYSSIAEASESIATGAKVSNEFLLSRINELVQRDKDRDVKDAERDKKEKELEGRMIVMQRRIEEQDRELVAWRDWSKRLSHQVISLGGTPVAFKPKQLDDVLEDATATDKS